MICSNYLDRSIIKKEIKKLYLKHYTGSWLLIFLLLLFLCRMLLAPIDIGTALHQRGKLSSPVLMPEER